MNDFLHANLVHTLIDDIVTEHTEISFIIERNLEITISSCRNVITSHRIHNNLHGRIRSSINKHINTQIHGRSSVFLLLSCITKMIKFCPDTILQTLRSLIDKGNELIASSLCCQTSDISKGGVPSSCQVYVNVHGIIATFQCNITRTIYLTIEQHITRVIGIIHQQIVRMNIEMISQILQMLMT